MAASCQRVDMPTKNNLFRIIGTAAVALSLPTAVSCSKKRTDSTTSHQDGHSPERKDETRDSTGESNPGQDKKPDTAKVTERSPSIRDQRMQSVARSLDQLELERRELQQTEEVAKAKLNGIRGVPANTAVDISNPAVSKDGTKEEQQAFEEYLTVALKLQELDAKEVLFKEQLKRARTQEDPKSGHADTNGHD
jgi:hypothetical protein